MEATAKTRANPCRLVRIKCDPAVTLPVRGMEHGARFARSAEIPNQAIVRARAELATAPADLPLAPSA